MAVAKSLRPALLALAGTVVAAALGRAMLRQRRQPRAGHDDSIEPRAMPGSAADIHVGSRPPVDVG